MKARNATARAMSHTTYGGGAWIRPNVATRPPAGRYDISVLLRTLATAHPPAGGEARHVMPSNGTTYDGTLARAAEATAKLQDEIDQLWNDAITAHEGVVCDRLVAVSHAIRRVFDLLDQRQVIG